MEVYILRHAIAVPRGTPGYPHDDRPLTDEGVRKMMKNAQGIAKVVQGFDIILTSPLRRAHDTAKIAADALKSTHKIKVCEELLPEQSVQGIYAALSKVKNRKRVLLVGHEPNLGEFASMLIGCKSFPINFKKGALCRIDIHEIPPNLPGRLLWYLSPKHLRMIA